jgi:DNA polymerase III alpha subunit (gram-positive type)
MSIGSDLLRFSDRKLLLFDMETNGLNLQHMTLPFQIAWIVADRKQVFESHQYYLKWPDYKMGKRAGEITEFNPNWVKTGTDPEHVLRAFESYLTNDQYLVVGHNIFYDMYIYQLWRRQFGLKPNWEPLSRLIDTNLLARAYKEGWKPDRANLKAWQYKAMAAFRKGVKTNLTLMCKELGVPVDETKTHDAAYDLTINWQVYLKLINLVEI